MSTPLQWSDGNFATAAKVGPPLFSAPFAGDTGRYLLQQEWSQLIANYSPLALGTAHPDYGTYLLVAEGPLQPLDGGIAKWLREYATVPAARSDYESYAARLPGLGYGVGTAGTINPAIPITSGALAGTTATITTTAPHGFTPGQAVAITYVGNVFNIKQTEYVYGVRVVTVPSATTFTYTTNVPISGYQFEFCQAAGYARPPLAHVVASRLNYQYYLPGVTGGITTVDDIPITALPVIVDQYGAYTETYTTNTTPNQAAYQTQINAGTWIVAEPTTLRRWKGNIYESCTRYIRAQ